MQLPFPHLTRIHQALMLSSSRMSDILRANLRLAPDQGMIKEGGLFYLFSCYFLGLPDLVLVFLLLLDSHVLFFGDDGGHNTSCSMRLRFTASFEY